MSKNQIRLAAVLLLSFSTQAFASQSQEQLIKEMNGPGGLVGKYSLKDQSGGARCSQNIELKVAGETGNEDLLVLRNGETETTLFLKIRNDDITQRGGNDIDTEKYSYSASARKVMNSYKDGFLFTFYSDKKTAELTGQGAEEILNITLANKQQGESVKTQDCSFTRVN